MSLLTLTIGVSLGVAFGMVFWLFTMKIRPRRSHISIIVIGLLLAMGGVLLKGM